MIGRTDDEHPNRYSLCQKVMRDSDGKTRLPGGRSRHGQKNLPVMDLYGRKCALLPITERGGPGRQCFHVSFSLGGRRNQWPRIGHRLPSETALHGVGVNCGRRLVQPVFFLELPRQILLRQVLKVFIGQRIQFVLQTAGQHALNFSLPCRFLEPLIIQ